MNVKVCGHVVLETGDTEEVALVAANGGGAVTEGVGVKVGVTGLAQFSVKLACGEAVTLGVKTWIWLQPENVLFTVQESVATLCELANANGRD